MEGTMSRERWVVLLMLFLTLLSVRRDFMAAVDGRDRLRGGSGDREQREMSPEAADPPNTTAAPVSGDGSTAVAPAALEERELSPGAADPPKTTVAPVSGDVSTAVAPTALPENVPDASVYDPSIVGRIDAWATASTEPVLMVVSHRDLLVGCNSFEQYLSPEFHTLIVLPRDFALHVKLDELVRSATPSKTAGLHLFYTDGDAGAVRARKVAIDFVEREINPVQLSAGIEKIDFIQYFDCNVHEIPGENMKNHYSARPTRDATLQMVRDFQKLKRGEVHPTNYDAEGYPALENGSNCTHSACFPKKLKHLHDVPHHGYGTLAMNALLFEDKFGYKFHGRDVTEWGPDRPKGGPTHWDLRATTGLKEGEPWIHDVSQFFEAHMFLFDIQAMKQIYNDYFSVAYPNFPSETVFFGILANRNKLRVVRTNDVSFNVDFGQSIVRWPPGVDMEWIKLKNGDLFGSIRNPKIQHDTWQKAVAVGCTQLSPPYIAMLQLQCRWDSWFPATWTETSLVREVYEYLAFIFNYYGYKPVNSTTSSDGGEIFRFKLEGKYDANRVFFQTKGDNDSSGNKIQVPAPTLRKGPVLSFQVGDMKYYHEAVMGGWERTTQEDLDRIVEVPAEGILPRSKIFECTREFDEWYG